MALGNGTSRISAIARNASNKHAYRRQHGNSSAAAAWRSAQHQWRRRNKHQSRRMAAWWHIIIGGGVWRKWLKILSASASWRAGAMRGGVCMARRVCASIVCLA